MPCLVNNGDELLIPLYEPSENNKPVTISWSQNLANRTAQYYALTVDNITNGLSSYPYQTVPIATLTSGL